MASAQFQGPRPYTLGEIRVWGSDSVFEQQSDDSAGQSRESFWSRDHLPPRCRGVVFKVMFHPKQLMVISAGDDAEVRVWDLITKSCAATLKVRKPCAINHTLAVFSRTASPHWSADEEASRGNPR